jgi:hypothetical protein
MALLKEFTLDTSLVLRWDVRAFLPDLNHDDPIPAVVEDCIQPDAFAHNADITEYWSMAERMVEMRRMKEKLLRTEPLSSDEEESYEQLLNDISCLVLKVGRWCSAFREANRVLENASPDKKQLYELWKRDNKIVRRFYRASLKSGQNVQQEEQNQTVYLEEDCKQLAQFAKDLADLAYYGIDFGVAASAAEFAKKFSDKTCTRKDANLFGRNAYLHCRTYLHQKKEADAGRELRKIQAEVRKVIPNAKFKQVNKWESLYRLSVYEGIHSAAKELCGKINYNNPDDDEPIDTLSKLQEKVTEAMDAIGGTFTEKVEDKSTLRKLYSKRGKKCIAFLRIKNDQYASFSGFMDCTDQAVIAQLGYKAANTNFVRDLEILCQAYLEATLAHLSEAVTGKMMRYEKGNDTPFGPLAQECKQMTLSREEFVPKYTCCERKILALLAYMGDPYTNADAKIIIKKPPCDSCQPALDKWVEKCAIRLEYDYPAPKSKQ